MCRGNLPDSRSGLIPVLISVRLSLVAVGAPLISLYEMFLRFHPICDFDEGKRSCRRKLERHNNRRRRKALESEDTLPPLDSGDIEPRSDSSPADGKCASSWPGIFHGWSGVTKVGCTRMEIHLWMELFGAKSNAFLFLLRVPMYALLLGVSRACSDFFPYPYRLSYVGFSPSMEHGSFYYAWNVLITSILLEEGFAYTSSMLRGAG